MSLGFRQRCNLLMTDMKGKNPWHRKIILCILFLFTLGIVSLVCIAIMQNRPLPENIKYGIVLDAGSSHTSVYVYSWPGEKENDTGIVTQIRHCNVKGPGISSYASEAEKAGESLQGCMDEAKKYIPERRHSETPVYLGATAGMRLLRQQNSNLSERVLASVKNTLHKYPFDFRGARIISGQEEGAYGWITINYLLGTFREDQGIFRSEPRKTYGALDLGGASTQITFVPNEPIESPNNQLYFQLYGRPYDVYTNSYICYGKDQALRIMLAKMQQESNSSSSIIKTPCFYKDFEMNYTNIYNSACTAPYFKEDMNSNNSILVVGMGEAEECRKYLRNLFNITTCNFSNCAFNDVFQPHVFGKFAAFSAFYYVMRTLNATDTPLPIEEIKEKTKIFCSKTWQKVKQEYCKEKEKERYLKETCFSANYILMLLEYGYHFSNETWKSIEFRGKIENADAGWTLGYMLNLTNMIPAESKQEPPLPYGGYVTLMVLFCIFLLILILIGCISFQRRSSSTGKYSI